MQLNRREYEWIFVNMWDVNIFRKMEEQGYRRYLMMKERRRQKTGGNNDDTMMEERRKKKMIQ